nr:hypothetical protein Iba_scaffold27444CG0010 [Ipomoea batatas]
MFLPGKSFSFWVFLPCLLPRSTKRLVLAMLKSSVTLQITPTPRMKWWKWRQMCSNCSSLNWAVPQSRHFLEGLPKFLKKTIKPQNCN